METQWLLTYSIDDAITDPLRDTVEVTVDFGGGRKRWLFFITPQQLAAVGDWIEGTRIRMHLGERHMIIVGELSESVIDKVLHQLHASGELEPRAQDFQSDGKAC